MTKIRYGKELTQEFLRELFDYDSDGYLVYRGNRGYNKTSGRRAGHLTKHGYLLIKIKPLGRWHAHRLIWLWHYGSLPEGDIDHIDHNRLNNRIENLRPATRTQNNHNARKRAGTSSRWKGVSRCKKTKQWHAYLNTTEGRVQLGRFECEADAAQIYNFAASRLVGAFSHMNMAEQDCPFVLECI